MHDSTACKTLNNLLAHSKPMATNCYPAVSMWELIVSAS